MAKTTLQERFLARVEPVTESGCWIWVGWKGPRGYGGVYRNHRRLYAHRVAWELYHGEIPKGLCVLHQCDVPCCVNPDHLFLGSHKDNMRDMVLKNRSTRGSRNPSARLTEESATKIKLATNRSTLSLAKQYGVSQLTVWKVRTRRTWKHL